MSMHYRLGWPFGLIAARMGVPISIGVDVIHDREAGVYVGTSNDLRGLVVEGDTLDIVKNEAHAAILELMELNHNLVPADSVARIRFNDNLSCA